MGERKGAHDNQNQSNCLSQQPALIAGCQIGNRKTRLSTTPNTLLQDAQQLQIINNLSQLTTSIYGRGSSWYPTLNDGPPRPHQSIPLPLAVGGGAAASGVSNASSPSAAGHCPQRVLLGQKRPPRRTKSSACLPGYTTRYQTPEPTHIQSHSPARPTSTNAGKNAHQRKGLPIRLEHTRPWDR